MRDFLRFGPMARAPYSGFRDFAPRRVIRRSVRVPSLEIEYLPVRCSSKNVHRSLELKFHDNQPFGTNLGLVATSAGLVQHVA
jgi:hypothetical protein